MKNQKSNLKSNASWLPLIAIAIASMASTPAHAEDTDQRLTSIVSVPAVQDIQTTEIYQKFAQVEPKKKRSWRDRLRSVGDQIGEQETTRQSQVPAAVTETDLKRAVEGFAKACQAEGSQDLGSCLESKLDASPLGLKMANRSVSNSMSFAPSLWQDTPLSANACSNGNFSSGQSGWSGYRLQRTGGGGLPLQNFLTARTPFASNACSQSYGDTCLNIETGGTDPIVSNLNKTYAGQSLVMGGYNSAGLGAEGVAKKFVKTSANDTYPFKYAISMQSSHAAHDSAFFAAIAMDSAGNVVDIVSDSADASNPFIQRQGNQYYRDWYCEKLDLSPVPDGDEVLVFFVNSDCAQGGHSGHTYIDDVCEDCGAGGDQGFVGVNATTDNCLDNGETQAITGTLSVPSGATNLSVDLKVYQNGALVATLPGATVSGTSYTKSIVRSDFPSLDCFDIVAELSFVYGGSAVTRTSDGANGFKPGQNNDICLNCGPVIVTDTVYDQLDPVILNPDFGDLLIKPELSDCCPPLSDDSILPLFVPEFQGPATGPYRMKYRQGSSEATQLNNQMQAYINYLNSLDSSITSINLNIRVHDRGPIGGPVNPGNGPQPSSESFITWTAGQNGTPSNGGGNFWNSYDLQPNQEYKIHVGIYLNDNKKFFSTDCSVRGAEFHWQVSGMRAAPGGNGTAIGEFKVKRNGQMQSLSKKTYKLNSDSMKRLERPGARR